MEKLALELGHLPLALEQAAAYLAKHRDTIAHYLALLPEARQTLLAYKIDWRQDERAAVAGTRIPIRSRGEKGARQKKPRQKAPIRPTGVDDALAELRRHSLLTLTPTSLALHRRLWYHRALRLADLPLPNNPRADDVRSWHLWTPLAPHLISLHVEPDAQPLVEEQWMIWLTGCFGDYLQGRGDYSRA